jgi:PmbA protein
MLEVIKNILAKNSAIDGYKICETVVESNELFFVKKNIDMDRAKSVHHYKVTVYVDIEEDGVKYRGSASTNVHPTMKDEEIEIAVKELSFAAQFVKNPYYPLVKPTTNLSLTESSKFSTETLPFWMNEITKAIYKNDVYEKGCINSAEIFLSKVFTHIVNSEGVDLQSTNFNCMVEFITTWKEEGEEVELYRCLNFSDFEPQLLEEEVKSMLMISKEKAVAKKTPKLDGLPVLLTREAVREFFTFYYSKSSASSVYNKASTWSIGDFIQGEQVKGDKVTLTVNPLLKNSTLSRGFDDDGYLLEEVRIIEEGELKRYMADTRYAYYLEVETTGFINNIVVTGGSKSLEELRKEPYIETAAFSDFTVDELTGDFCGEIRLGWYFDGDTTTPITGGSITGNIQELHNELYLSKELQRDNGFEGPKAVKLNNVIIAGVE